LDKRRKEEGGDMGMRPRKKISCGLLCCIGGVTFITSQKEDVMIESIEYEISE
jgi:hypothetical protein